MPLRGDILAKVRRLHIEALPGQLIEQLGWNEVNLPQIGLSGIDRDARAMPDGRAGMRIALDAQSLDQPDRRDRRLGETMRAVA